MSEERDGLTADTVSNAGTVSFGQYHILELIGAGGMAEVYRASSVGPGGFVKPVVIKRVKPKHARDPGFISMFVDEAKLSAKLQHPNIVTVFEFGEIDGHHYIAMEYIDGLHLQAVHVRHMQLRQQPLPWPVCMIIARDILLGLDYAHEKTDDRGVPMSLVHRDINLVNIMVGRSGAVKVLDFGIVKAAGGVRSAETVGGVLKGKFGYMSPEQAEGKALDRRSDVFSASIVLHELLTGRRLFWGEDDLVILRKVCGGEIVDPRAYRPELPEPLVAAVMKGLARRLEDRWSTAGAMADALDVIIAENRVSEGSLRTLMEELLPPEPSEASETMRQRRRRVTLMAWSGGVKDAEAPGVVVSGVLGVKDAQATSAGKKSGQIVSGVGESQDGAQITAEPRWLVPESVPAGDEHAIILGEQDTTVVTEGAIGDEAADAATVILQDDEQREGLLASLQEKGEPGDSSGRPALEELTGAETRILDAEVHGETDSSGQGASRAGSADEASAVLSEDSPRLVEPAPVQPGRSRVRMALLAVLAAMLIALVLLLVLRR